MGRFVVESPILAQHRTACNGLPVAIAISKSELYNSSSMDLYSQLFV